MILRQTPPSSALRQGRDVTAHPRLPNLPHPLVSRNGSSFGGRAQTTSNPSVAAASAHSNFDFPNSDLSAVASCAAASRAVALSADDTTLACLIAGRTVTLHRSQREALTTLARGQHCLAIMATGRGKSLIFQTHAVKLALRQGSQSIFIYPLRALLADQEQALSRSLAPLGLRCASMSGTTTPEERQRLYADIMAGRLHIVLTTPEFALCNARLLLQNGRFGFLVLDEAHHIATSTQMFRADYKRLAVLRQAAPEATILAVTATADEPVCAAICQGLGIEAIIADSSRRPNLHLDDQRALATRERYLAGILEGGHRTIVYVNSRTLSQTLCRTMRKLLGRQGGTIGFYHAGMTNEDRHAVEEAFRSGQLASIIATSAFGEGVNIPDIASVVLYDLPFSLIDFNQMAGRAGRDGSPAFIHLLCQPGDQVHNVNILRVNATSAAQLSWLLDQLNQLKSSKAFSKNGSRPYHASRQDLAQYLAQASKQWVRQSKAGEQDGVFALSSAAIPFALMVLEEVGLLERLSPQGSGSGLGAPDDEDFPRSLDPTFFSSANPRVSGHSPARSQHLTNAPVATSDAPVAGLCLADVARWRLVAGPVLSKSLLAKSVLYTEGQKSLQFFTTFAHWMFSADAEELLKVLRKPLLPQAAPQPPHGLSGTDGLTNSVMKADQPCRALNPESR